MDTTMPCTDDNTGKTDYRWYRNGVECIPDGVQWTKTTKEGEKRWYRNGVEYFPSGKWSKAPGRERHLQMKVYDPEPPVTVFKRLPTFKNREQTNDSGDTSVKTMRASPMVSDNHNLELPPSYKASGLPPSYDEACKKTS